MSIHINGVQLYWAPTHLQTFFTLGLKVSVNCSGSFVMDHGGRGWHINIDIGV